MVSRLATCGFPTLASTLDSRRIRSTRMSRWSSPMPPMTVWPVSGSSLTRKVGSSSASFWMAMDSFSWSPLVFGSMGTSMSFPEPVLDVAIGTKTKGDQEKLSIAIQKLAEEDPTFRVRLDPETGQTVIGGMGELHLDILVERMRREFKVEANVGKPQVAYRETIRRTVAKIGYVHKKQTGGSGQYAKVQMRFEPLDAAGGELYEFVNAVSGGRIPREYIPSVDAGIQSAMELGVLAGLPLVGVKATLLDGAYHEVDSSEMAFKIAGSMVLKEAARKADPVLLEPIMAVEGRTPVEYMGEVIGDLSSRRGMIQSMEDATGVKVIRSHVPLSEMFGYVGDLRSKTQGRAVYSMQFDSYAEVPRNVAEEIIKKTRGE